MYFVGYDLYSSENNMNGANIISKLFLLCYNNLVCTKARITLLTCKT